jgi:hypothetical protein
MENPSTGWKKSATNNTAEEVEMLSGLGVEGN